MMSCPLIIGCCKMKDLQPILIEGILIYITYIL
jgi:hypothetical protein